MSAARALLLGLALAVLPVSAGVAGPARGAMPGTAPGKTSGLYTAGGRVYVSHGTGAVAEAAAEARRVRASRQRAAAAKKPAPVARSTKKDTVRPQGKSKPPR